MRGGSVKARRDLWLGAGDAWTWVAELLTATAVWGAIGFGLDRLFGTGPALLVIGAIVGYATGIFILWHRARRQMNERAEAQRKERWA